MLVGSGSCAGAASHRGARRRSPRRADRKGHASSPLLFLLLVRSGDHCQERSVRALHGGWLTPLAQPPVGYPQVACHLSQQFTAGLRERHSFDFELMCEAPLCFRHHALFLEAVILVYIFSKRGLSPLSDSHEGSIEGFLGKISLHQITCHFHLLRISELHKKSVMCCSLYEPRHGEDYVTNWSLPL